MLEYEEFMSPYPAGKGRGLEKVLALGEDKKKKASTDRTREVIDSCVSANE
jgi:hypothetical protein